MRYVQQFCTLSVAESVDVCLVSVMVTGPNPISTQ